MASIHKRERSPFWVASFQDAQGRWIKKSTKTTNRAEATRIANQWADLAEQGRSGRLVEGQARKVISEIHERATGSPINFYTCDAWLDEWIAGKTGATGERSLLKYKQICREFKEVLGTRTSLSLAVINQADIRRFRDAQVAMGKAPTTVNQNVLKILSAPFAAAVRAGYITHNPCVGVEGIKDHADTEKDVFTPEQLEALCRAASGDWVGAILMGFYTGLRLKDISEMEWQSIEVDQAIIRVRTKKTAQKLAIPIAPVLLEWISAQPQGIGRAKLFPQLAGKSGTGRSGLSMQFRRIMEKAGIRGRILREGSKGGAGRAQSSLSFHSLRHTFNSALANAGASQELRQKLTGHKSVSMNDRYTHLQIDALRSEVAKLPHVRRS